MGRLYHIFKVKETRCGRHTDPPTLPMFHILINTLATYIIYNDLWSTRLQTGLRLVSLNITLKSFDALKGI